MKKIFLSLAIVASLAFTSSAYAQGNKKGGRGNGSSFQKELNLSDEQKQKMDAVRSEYRVKANELKEDKNLSKEDKLSKNKELQQQRMAAVNSILTPEQQTKMKELQTKKGDRSSKKYAGNNKKSDRNKRNGDIARNARVKDLNLTDDQKEKIKSLNEDFRTKSRELAKEHREELNKVYTPEQQAKLKESRKEFSKDRKSPRHGNRNMMANLDEASKEKMKTLRENFQKEKKAIEMSRIAPDVQKEKIADLRQSFRKERQEIIKGARNTQDNKTV